MKIYFLTIALDASPFIQCHLPVFQRLALDWEWLICEGVALPLKDTNWCAAIPPRLSNDGTSEYLKSIAGGRVTLFQNPSWPGKVTMFNRMLGEINQPAIIMQIDADELWLPHQIELIHEWMIQSGGATRMDFHCRYFVGKDIVITSRNTYGNNDAYEWRRVWRFTPGMQFETHEPPKIRGDERKVITQAQTEEKGLVFEHLAYCTRAQVAFKEKYYKYPGAVAQWEVLQQNQQWPLAELKAFLPWVGDGVTADKLYRK